MTHDHAARQPRLRVVPISQKAAQEYVRRVHRSHGPKLFAKASIGAVCEDGVLHGVAVLATPAARHNDDGATCEVSRLASDGTPNVCSFLLGRSHRVATALGYSRVITYTRAEESGVTLRAAGWRFVRTTKGGNWARHPRPGRATAPHLTGPKKLFEKR